MNFTPQEQKMVEGLRKRQSRSQKWRFYELLIGIGQIGFGFLIFSEVQNMKNQSGPPDVFLLFFTMFYPIALMAIVSGSLLAGTAIRDWHGNVQSTLLLKLIDHCESEGKDSKQS
jgi:hypothetical protein